VLKRRAAAAAMTLVVLVAGCGGDDGPAAEPERELPYHRWSYPAGGEAAARGVVLTLHGGSWRSTGRAAARSMRGVVKEMTAEGYAVLNGTYPPGREGIEGVEALYVEAGGTGDGGGVCVYGRSAGGSWALELAIRHHDLACVVAEAPATDLAALARVSRGARRTLTGIFGSDLNASSPIRGPFSDSTRIMIAGVTTDRVVPWSQARRFKRAWPETELLPVRPGRVPWVHAFADRASLGRFEASRDRFLEAALR
jgi:dipeptidyl aminopeptidase/acylaminoacyl peptidase